MRKKVLTTLLLLYIPYILLWLYRLAGYSNASGISGYIIMLGYFSVMFTLFAVIALPGIVGIFWFLRGISFQEIRLKTGLRITGVILSAGWAYFWILPPFLVKLPGWQILYSVF